MKRARLVAGAAAYVVLVLGIIGADAAGLRINITPSVPIGVWRLSPGANFARGDTVSVCPKPSKEEADAGIRCAWMFRDEPVFKPVAAVAGDLVEVTPSGIRVNDVLLPNTAVPEDIQTRGARPGEVVLDRMTPGRYVVEQGSVWILSSYNDRSYDSRYYGPIPASFIEGKLALYWGF